MELDLYLREADGNHIILHQREKYDDVQVVPLDAERKLRRGGAVVTDTELSGMVRGFLSRQLNRRRHHRRMGHDATLLFLLE